MTGLFVNAVIGVWVIGNGLTGGISALNITNYKISSDISCPWKWPTFNAENWTERKELICHLTVKRSSCELCTKQKTRDTIPFKTKQKIFETGDTIRLSGLTLYGTTIHSISCTMKIQRARNVTISETQWDFRAQVRCKKRQRFRETFPGSTPCSKNINSNCSVDCSGHQVSRVQCNRHAIFRRVAVVGCILGGVVFTGVAVGLWRICRKRSRNRRIKNEERESHIYLGLTPRGISNVGNLSLSLTDVTTSPLTPVAEIMVVNDYEELPDCQVVTGKSDDRKLDEQVAPSRDQGEYLVIQDEKRDEMAVHSKERACIRPLPTLPKLQGEELQNNQGDQYTDNKLGINSAASCQSPDTYNRACVQIRPAPDLFNKENNDPYNRLRYQTEAGATKEITYDKDGLGESEHQIRDQNEKSGPKESMHKTRGMQEESGPKESMHKTRGMQEESGPKEPMHQARDYQENSGPIEPRYQPPDFQEESGPTGSVDQKHDMQEECCQREVLYPDFRQGQTESMDGDSHVTYFVLENIQKF